MAHFLRGKQAGIQNDLSGGLGPDLFCLDDVSTYLPQTPRISWKSWQGLTFKLTSSLDMA